MSVKGSMRFKMVFPKGQQVQVPQVPQVKVPQVPQVPQVQPKQVRFKQLPANLSMKGLFVKTASCKACSRK
jgi:hypothetical protein